MTFNNLNIFILPPTPSFFPAISAFLKVKISLLVLVSKNSPSLPPPSYLDSQSGLLFGANHSNVFKTLILVLCNV